MGTYLKRFIFGSLFYLGLAAIFGILNGTTDIGYCGIFAHTHFNLLGFMSMMIYGIGYFIIPRFNGVDLRFPGWVAPHFWLGNISLIGMVLFRGLSIEMGDDIWNTLFIIAAVIQVITIFMFIANVWITLTPRVKNPVKENKPASEKPARPANQPQAPAPAPAPKPVPVAKKALTINGDSPIAELIDADPTMLDYLADNGLSALRITGHLDKVRMMGVTIGMAAANHGLDLKVLINGIKENLQVTPESAQKAAPTAARNSVITAELNIGQVIEEYPESRDIFEKYFGNGCFECPGQAYESIDMACRIHSIDPNVFVEELKIKLGV